ncbi:MULTISPECIES: hypothetical protein [Methylobacter]
MSKDLANELQQKQPSSKLIPVPEWNKHHSWPPQGGLRHLIFNEKTNGFASAFKRVGRRVLVDEAEFFACVDKQNQVG